MFERQHDSTGQITNVTAVYNVYRIVLPLILLVSYFTGPDTVQFGRVNPTLFIQACTGYAIFGVIVAFFATTSKHLLRDDRLLSATIIADIFVITLLIYTSGGVSSGLGLLMIVTIAAGGIMIHGRMSIFLAAVATLAIFYSEFVLILNRVAPSSQFVPAGILGTILFATALYIRMLAQRIHRTAQLAHKQAGDIVDLEQLNNEIIERMRTGIVVVNKNNIIVSMNSSAQAALSPLLREAPVGGAMELPVELAEQVKLWKLNAKRQPHPISIPKTNKQLQLNFALLKPEDPESDVLIFMEDNLQIVQRVRQTKLASLGRLTASIAHEVRNPLGAISHASQLLKESDAIKNDDDQRMVDIILGHCDRVNMIIQDVLDASRHDDTSPSRINLHDWLVKFIDSYKATHELCDEIELDVQPADTEINIITGQLEQVLNNLFDNGLRYSHKATGRATLKVVGGNEHRNGDVQPFLHVIDDGPGIDEANEASLFEPFYTTEKNGTGLGLYISRELCEANQSQLIYNRTSDGRSRFSIYFSHPDRSMD